MIGEDVTSRWFEELPNPVGLHQQRDQTGASGPSVHRTAQTGRSPRVQLTGGPGHTSPHLLRCFLPGWRPEDEAKPGR